MAVELAWEDYAACYNTTADMFTTDMDRVKELIAAYCEDCPVIPECAAEGLIDATYLSGIWGGIYVNLGSAGRKKKVRQLRELVGKDAA